MPRILVTHHPLFALPVDNAGELGKAIGRQDMALDIVADAGVDLLLAGHNHRASTHHAPDLVTRAASTLVVQAGTATSTRGRGETNSFNVVRIEVDRVEVDRYGWDVLGKDYSLVSTEKFLRSGNIWTEHNEGLMAAGI